MLKLDGRLCVTFDLAPDAYIFYPDSATGKTRLCNYLRGLYPNVLVCTATPEFKCTSKELSGYDVVILDRFDLYLDFFPKEYLRKVSRNSILLMDLKQVEKIPVIGAGIVYIKWDGREVVLTE